MKYTNRLLYCGVILLVLAGIAMTGASAATDDVDERTVDVTNETVLYQGQTGLLSLEPSDHESVTLLTPDGEFVREYASNETVRIDPTDLETPGTYTLGGISYNETTDTLTATGNRSDEIILERVTHTLETNVDYPVRTTMPGDSSKTVFTVSSNRESAPVTVHSPDLSGSQLADRFETATDINETTVRLESDAVAFDAEGLPPGSYEFITTAQDTTATALTTLLVTEDRDVLAFADADRFLETPSLGLATATVEFTHAETAFLTLSDLDGYTVVLEVTDTVGEGTVTVGIETATAGEIPEDDALRCDGSDAELDAPGTDSVEASALPEDCLFDESSGFFAIGDGEVTVYDVIDGDGEEPLAGGYDLSLTLLPEASRTEQDFATLRVD